MHGYNNRLRIARDLCLNYDIVLLQELWLPKDNLCKLSAVDTNFEYSGLSCTSNKASQSILICHPFGGVTLLWKKIKIEIC